VRKPVPVVGKVEPGSGRTTMIRGEKLAGSGERFIRCPVCGELLDKTDPVSMLAHEQAHGEG
jgi:hypothetical protein